MTSIWAFIILVFVFVVLASMLAYVVEERDEAIRANEALHKDNATLRRYLDKRNHHIMNLMVENYELHNLVNQAHGKGFIPQQFRQGREN